MRVKSTLGRASAVLDGAIRQSVIVAELSNVVSHHCGLGNPRCANRNRRSCKEVLGTE